ncbi:hypothetical protein [Microbacterium cremeum]|uniref:hypothetical protein n=1 Tax=Microbacterium cremeum TaxID=2782169 RepID=UPI001887A94E|nr:hypothetical protein [Microbacterium cremeum]
MTAPDPYAPTQSPRAASWLRAAIWVAIGALIAAAIVCVIWVLVGDQNDIVGRAFLTILLLAAFAGVAILDAHLAPRRPAWFALASMATWIVTLLLGAVMIWMPERFPWLGFSRFIQFLLIVLILQLVLLHVRLYMKAFQRYDTPFTRIVAIVTITLVVSLAALLVIPLAFGEWLDLPEIYWRIVVAVAILAAVGTAVIPLVNLLFAPKKPQPQPMAYGYGQAAIPAGPYAPAEAQSQTPAYAPAPPSAPEPAAQELLPWPTYVDGATPLPMLPDGSPDWNAYYTGYPTPGAHVFAPADAAAQAPSASEQAPEPPVSPQAPTAPSGYEGYPPPPPLPPRS